MKKNGFTLIELIISIVLVGIILASMIGTLVSLKNTYGIINEDVEARTYSALVSKVINEHLMKNNGIKSYACSDTVCHMKLGTNKEMTLEIITSEINRSDMKDASTGNKVGTLVENVTTIKYYGAGYSYYKTIKHYDKVYNEGGTVELGYKFNKLSGEDYVYTSNTNPDLKDYLVNITIEMNDPKYNIELYATSLVDDDDIGDKYRIYTLTYNSNGGLSCVPESKSVLDRHPWGTLCIPTRDNHGFKGWFIQPSGENVEEVTSDTIAVEDITVYAHWDKNKYSCAAGTYLPKGHTSCADCLSDYYCPGVTDVYYDKFNDQGIEPCLTGYHSDPRSIDVSACKISCEENTHVKNVNDAYCSSCATGYQKGAHEVVQGHTSACTLVPIDKPTISGGGTKIYGSGDFTLTCTTPSSYASGTTIYYQFGYASNTTNDLANWTTASTTNTLTVSKTAYVGNRYYACKVSVSGGGTSSDAESDRTLVRINNAKVTFDAATNGGVITGTENGTKDLYTRTGVTGLYTGIRNSTAATVPTGNKTGHTFNGWYTLSSDGSKVYNSTPTLQSGVTNYTDSSGKWIITANKTIYAQYTPITYNLTFDCNGGSKTSGKPANTTVTYGAKYTLTSDTCTRSGYTQDGWNESSTGDGTPWTTSNTVDWTWNYTNDVTLYAVWTPINYTVAFTSGNSNCTLNTSTYSNKTGTYNSNLNIANPSCGNYSFDGWTANSNLNTSTAKYGTSSSDVTTSWSNANTKTKATYFKNLRNTSGTVTLTANWQENIHTVTLDNNLFIAGSKTQNGVTITYDGANQYITLNGTTTTNSFSFDKLPNMSFTSGSTYKILLTYVSGSYTSTASSNLFVMDFQKDGANYSGRTSGTHYKSVSLPSSGTQNNTITYTLSDANGLYFWFWHTADKSTTFSNYKMRVSITKVETVTPTYGSAMPTITKPVKTGFTFGGYYTGYNGTGTQYYNAAGNSAKTCDLTVDTILYAKWTVSATPVPTITAKKSSAGTTVASDTWSNEGLNFILSTTSPNTTLKYCKDTNNTCTPSTIATKDATITTYNTVTGIYYIRYQAINSSFPDVKSNVLSYKAKVDTASPTGSLYVREMYTGNSISNGGIYQLGVEWGLGQVTATSGVTIKACMALGSTSCTLSTIGRDQHINYSFGTIDNVGVYTNEDEYLGYYEVNGNAEGSSKIYIKYSITTGAGNTKSGSFTANPDTEAPTCSLSVSSSKVTLSSTDNVNGSISDGLIDYGMRKGNSSADYNEVSSMNISVGTFYGFVRDNVDNSNSCSVQIVAKNATYTCTASPAIRYSGTCVCNAGSYGYPTITVTNSTYADCPSYCTNTYCGQCSGYYSGSVGGSLTSSKNCYNGGTLNSAQTACTFTTTTNDCGEKTNGSSSNKYTINTSATTYSCPSGSSAISGSNSYCKK